MFIETKWGQWISKKLADHEPTDWDKEYCNQVKIMESQDRREQKWKQKQKQ